MSTCSNIEQEYSESLKFIRTVKSELIKVDIAKLLSDRWKQDIEDVKKHLSVSVDTADEKLKDFADIYDCFGALDNTLDEEEIGIGYAKVDSNVTFRKKWVVILGAYSFSGKTNNLIEWILHWIVRLHKRVLFFSLEMPKEDVVEVIMGKIAKIPPYKIKETIRSPEGSVVYQRVADVIQRYLYIVDRNSLSIDDIEDYIEIANVNVFDEPVDIVCVDYYQYLKGTTEYSDDSKTARKMKEIAKEHNIVLVMLSQFNKQSQYSDKGKVKEPTQNDLKGAGDIGASADVIYLIWRPALMGNLTEIERKELEYITRLKIAKARKGLKHGVSHFELRYDIGTGCLEEI
jgi:Replicative DNA helicase